MGTMHLPTHIAAALLWAACHALAVPGIPAGAAAAEAPPEGADVPQPPDMSVAESDPELKTGLILYSAESGNWDLRLAFPFSVGLTEFDLDTGVSLDNVATVAVVPTLEFIVPLDRKWTLLPYAGIGGAAAVGDQRAVSGENMLGLVSGGLRLQRWEPFAARYVSVLSAEARYNAVLSNRNGLLGDWGSLTGVVELRRAFGAPRDGPRFQAGVYAQGFRFWDPIELEIPGVTPSFLHNQWEFGLSLGSSTPYEIWGLTVPRVFIGVRTGEKVRSLYLSFGRL